MKRITRLPLVLLGVSLLMLAWSTAGCNDLLEVDNPNSLIEDDLENPSAARAIADGAKFAVGQAISFLLLQHATASDELVWSGSRDAWNQIDRGFVLNPVNEFSNAAFPFVGEGRWLADNAIRLLEGFGDNLSDKNLLAQAYLYGWLIYTAIADEYNDFVISDKREPGSPIGPTNMVGLYDTALQYFDRGLAIATGDVKTQLTASKAITEHARARWSATRNASGLVDAGAATARQALATIGETNDLRFFFTFSPQINNEAADWVNQRQEQSIDPRFTSLVDPATGAVDPRAALESSLWSAGANDDLTPLTYASTRELMLIVAESELAKGNTAAAAEWLNKVRALGEAPAFDPAAVDVQEMLIHERDINLYMQLSRWHDLYRFGIALPDWDGNSDVRTPGTYYPIADVEVRANPNIN